MGSDGIKDKRFEEDNMRPPGRALRLFDELAPDVACTDLIHTAPPRPKQKAQARCAPAPFAKAGRLFGRGSDRLDKARHPFVATPEAVAVHRLELGRRERMGRRPLPQCLAPRLEPRVILDMAE